MALTAIGTAASLAELLHLVQAGIKICKTIRDAPKEIQRAETTYQSLQTTIKLFAEVYRDPRNHVGLPDEQAVCFKSFLEIARISLTNIETDFAQEIRRTLSPQSWNGRIQYALQGKKKIDMLLKELSTIQNSVTMFLQIVQIQLQCSQMYALDQFLNAQNSRAVERVFQRPNRTLGSNSPLRNHPRSRTAEPILPENAARFEHTETSALTQNSQTISEVCVPLQKRATKDLTEGTTYDQLPDLERMKACFVAPYSQIMLASRIGDAALILQVINDQNDIQYSHTTGNLTPLCFAAESGNIAAVQTLLHNGVSVNSIFGTRSSISLCAALTYRQVEVTRLLICRGASYSHRNINGWSPLFYIWMKEEIQAPATEVLQLLSKFSDFALLHKDVYDICGWGVMHRVAAYGTAADIVMLISFGLDPLQNMKPTTEEGKLSNYHEWSVLRIAVCYGRLETCMALLPYYEAAGCVDTPDSQGWTLLHLAIEQGHLEIAKLLIEYGAKVDARTEPTLSGEPGDTTGYEYTPLLLAKEIGSEYYEKVCDLISNTTAKPPSKMLLRK